MVSIGQMIRELAPMVGSPDLKDWENRFMKNVVSSTGTGARTSMLTGDQVEKVEEIYERRYAVKAEK
jgi:hypothetical protein